MGFDTRSTAFIIADIANLRAIYAAFRRRLAEPGPQGVVKLLYFIPGHIPP
jgi:hypothetical protein